MIIVLFDLKGEISNPAGHEKQTTAQMRAQNESLGTWITLQFVPTE